MHGLRQDTVMYIALDDTDSKDGMCTTYLVTELIKEFDEYQLLSYPRLVRLNPNIPWKTRGNGAVVLTIGKGKVRKEVIGKVDREIDIWTGDPCIEKNIMPRAKKVVDRWAESDKEGTDPGLVVGNGRPPGELYEKGVKEVLELDHVKEVLDSLDLDYWGGGSERGLIGAASALAWTPEDSTYELITYRRRDLWGEPRLIDHDDVKTLDMSLEHGFNNYDHVEHRQGVAPGTPCPVLYGVRGDEPNELKKALVTLKGERPERWLTFLTNQGTDDHIRVRDIRRLEPFMSARVTGTVCSPPRVIRGGHIFFEVSRGGATVTAAAFEPTKSFRDIINRLIVGDEIELWGGIKGEPLTLNIEKLKINRLAEKITKIGNPVCPYCGKSMGSMGTDSGYRCKKCRYRSGENTVHLEIIPRNLKEGWYEVPVIARRHLSKPLKRFNVEEGNF